MFQSQRIIFSDNAVLSDLSISLNDYRASSSTLAVVAAEDALYIGSEFPFNHKYFDIGTANTSASVVSVNIWWARAWHDAVDVVDETAVTGKTLAQDGYIRWNTDWLKGWDREQKSEDVTGLTGTNIYDMYWVKLSFSGNLFASTSLNAVGYKFNSDSQLYGQYPDLNNSDLRTAFASGKADWAEQSFAAAEAIIAHLKGQGIIKSANQILDHELLTPAAIHKTAEIIYGGMGKSYEEARKAAGASFKSAVNIKNFNTDKNSDGSLSRSEKSVSTGWFTR